MKIYKKIIDNISYAKILLPTLLTIGLFIIAIFIVVIPQFEDIIIDRKREMIKELTNSTVSMINKWHQLQIDGTLTEEEAQESAINLIRHLRYGDEQKDYFWVTDLYPKMVVHPYRPELNGTELTSFQDSHGKLLFVEMVESVKPTGEGYVDYMWQWKDDSLKIVPKLSYVKMFQPWNWVVGTGIYIEDVKEEISRLEHKIISISLIITFLSTLLLSYIAFQNLKSEKRRREAENELKESRERYRMLVEASGEGLIMILDNKQVFYNKTFYAMLGYPESESNLKLPDIFISIPDSEMFDFRTFKRKENKQILNEQIETKIKKANGDTLNVLLDLSQISFLNNNGVVINIKDISLNKEIEEALDYTKGKYLALTNQISIGVFRATADKKADFIEVNPALVNLLGAESSDNLISESFLDYFYDDEDKSLFIDEVFEKGTIKNKIIRLRRENGTYFTASISAVLARNLRDEIQSIDGIIEDITEQQRSDREREKLISDLQTSVVILSQIIKPYIKTLPDCNYTTTIFEAALIMTDNKINSLLVKGNNEEEIGIITDRDIRVRIVSGNKNLTEPVYTIMTAPISSIKSTATIYDALVIFREKKIRHLIVKDSDNKVIGILDIDDVFEVSYSNYLFFIEKIESAEDVNKLNEYRNHLIHLVKGLINNNVDLRSTTKMFSLITDSITKKIIKIAINELGEPPCNFAFLAMGSEGREEQTLSTDQDNAIVFEDISAEQNFEEIQKYFLALGKKISDYLNDTGYFYCKGGIMASNIKWCQPLSVWKKYFTNWVTTASPQDLLDLKIFFDYRFIYGDSNLSEELRKHINKLTNSYGTFFVYLAENLINSELSDNIIKLKSPIDLKLVLLPIVDFARLYGLRQNLITNNTIERLEHIHEKGILSDSMFQNIFYSYSILMQKRLANQVDSHSSNKTVDNLINPQNLSDIEVIVLKKYFELLKDIKNKINLDFKGTLVR